jgi:uncharacterized membrane protein YGL010W
MFSCCTDPKSEKRVAEEKISTWFEHLFGSYIAHHNNSHHKLVHTFCVWPIFVTAMIMLTETPAIFTSTLEIQKSVNLPHNIEVNSGWILAAVVAVRS